MKIRSLIGRSRTDRIYRITAKGINSENKQHNAAEQLQIKTSFINIIGNEAHAITRKQRLPDLLQIHTNAPYSKSFGCIIRPPDREVRTQQRQ